jgi:hypothetical protein
LDIVREQSNIDKEDNRQKIEHQYSLVQFAEWAIGITTMTADLRPSATEG